MSQGADHSQLLYRRRFAADVSWISLAGLNGSLLWLAAGLSWCATPPAPNPQHISLPESNVSLQGSVRVAGGGTISQGVKVRLETIAGELIAERPVTTGGQFEFSNLPKKVCRVIVSGTGYETSSQTLDLDHAANVYFLNISLTPAIQIQARDTSPPARTDLGAPKEARKEFKAGSKALAARNIRRAQAHLEKAVGIYPCYARAQTDLGLVQIAQRNWALAESALRRAIECDPDFLDSYIALGELLNGDKRFAESKQVIEEGARRAPASWQFFYQLGIAYFGMAKNGEAEQAFLKAQSLSPHVPAEIHIKLADVYVREREFSKAYAQMQAYLEADPQGKFAAQTRKVMNQMAAAGVLPSSGHEASSPKHVDPQNP